MTIHNAIAAIRRYFGWANISEERLSPEHGWLLPTASQLHALPTEHAGVNDGSEPAVHGGPRWLAP